MQAVVKWGLVLLLVLAVVWWWWPASPIVHPPGVLVAEAPVQGPPPVGVAPWKLRAYTVTPLAGFEARGRVLSISRYRFDREAQIAPYDLALGWGPMSDQSVVDQLQITQASRWFRVWWRSSPPIDTRVMMQNASNMHLIPSSKLVKAQLGRLVRGDVVTIKGYLIEATTEDGWRWRSSLSRDDKGGHACEVIWVLSVERAPR